MGEVFKIESSVETPEKLFQEIALHRELATEEIEKNYAVLNEAVANDHKSFRDIIFDSDEKDEKSEALCALRAKTFELHGHQEALELAEEELLVLKNAA